MTDHHLDPIGYAVSFVTRNNFVDYFLFGVDTVSQLRDILDSEQYEQKDMDILQTAMEILQNAMHNLRKAMGILRKAMDILQNTVDIV